LSAWSPGVEGPKVCGDFRLSIGDLKETNCWRDRYLIRLCGSNIYILYHTYIPPSEPLRPSRPPLSGTTLATSARSGRAGLARPDQRLSVVLRSAPCCDHGCISPGQGHGPSCLRGPTDVCLPFRDLTGTLFSCAARVSPSPQPPSGAGGLPRRGVSAPTRLLEAWGHRTGRSVGTSERVVVQAALALRPAQWNVSRLARGDDSTISPQHLHKRVG